MPRRLLSFALVLLFATTAPNATTAQSHEQAVEAAKQAAREWLSLVDAGKYEATWREAGASLRAGVPTAEQWAKQIRRVHSKLDSIRSRSIVAARYTTSLSDPNAPEGEYVVVQYRSWFGKEKRVETVILSREADEWRVIGYFVKPV